MVLTVTIGRTGDGLILCASTYDRDQISSEYQNQAKQLFKTLNRDSPPRMTIESPPYVFYYLLEYDVCYICLCEKTFPKRVAFSFLEEIAVAFQREYGDRINQVTRPYCCIEFDTYIQSAKKKLSTTRSRRNINALNNDLQDVHRIMVQNIGDVLQRGVAISDLDSKASNLSLMSQNYKKGARLLNSRATWAKIATGCILGSCFFLYYWLFF